MRAMTEGMPGTAVTPGTVVHAGISGDGRGGAHVTYPVRQHTGSRWYHDHRMSWTGLGVWQWTRRFAPGP
ncbi:Multicopper oxidase CueO OS=Streptomyces glaucescens OX=1907 GN=cotA PE=4 SV=1 [Streptomyces glaucescens]